MYLFQKSELKNCCASSARMVTVETLNRRVATEVGPLLALAKSNALPAAKESGR